MFKYGNGNGKMVNNVCKMGYILFGNKIQKCQPDGEWSGYNPKCQRKLFFEIVLL